MNASDEIDGLFDRFLAAWDNRDLDAVVECFSADAVYHASVGPEPGESAKGRLAIRNLVEKMFETDKGARSEITGKIIKENSIAWTWVYTLPDGSREYGCDFFTVSAEGITLKDAYRKTRRP